MIGGCLGTGEQVRQSVRHGPIFLRDSPARLSMDALVFAAVLFAAACHAGWNASIKRGLDPLASTVAISLGAALVALFALPVLGLPAPEALPWVLASIAIHLFYFAALIESYRTGD